MTTAAGITGTVEGEILGFRQWRVDDDLRLCSAGVQHVWEKGDNEATCKRDDNLLGGLNASHYMRIYEYAMRNGVSMGEARRKLGLTETGTLHDAPHADCHCGLYALHEPSFWYGPEGRVHKSVEGLVSGLVVAWGEVEVHHEGFRAQHARVAAIAVPEGKRAAVLAHAVAQEYGVPAVPQADLEKVAPEYGSVVPDEMRPEHEPVTGTPSTTITPGVSQHTTVQYSSTGNVFRMFVSGADSVAVRRRAIQEINHFSRSGQITSAEAHRALNYAFNGRMTISNGICHMAINTSASGIHVAPPENGNRRLARGWTMVAVLALALAVLGTVAGAVGLGSEPWGWWILTADYPIGVFFAVKAAREWSKILAAAKWRREQVADPPRSRFWLRFAVFWCIACPLAVTIYAVQIASGDGSTHNWGWMTWDILLTAYWFHAARRERRKLKAATA